ncbi:hypothetical protein LJR220_003360 [Bradyrhizobium sp. LjRoot220]|uniref:hypothetical protein n=1 Tax=Bradyrhizobium sp. LjRoot220 TaxID=3342284 RepID=UPI003ECFE0AE
MDVSTGAVLVSAIGAAVAVYAIHSIGRGKDRDSKVKHDEFKAALEPGHREAMTKIAANRDIEIAKATKKEPSPVIDGTATRQLAND